MAKTIKDDSYTVNVTFTRSLSDDSGVVRDGNPKARVTDRALMLQFRKELQQAYDNPDVAMAGSFNITKVTTGKARRAWR